LAQLLLENGDRHVTAEELHGEALTSGISVSLATVYNTLHQFTEAGLLRETPSSRGARISTPTRPITIISSVKRPANCTTSRHSNYR